MNVPGKDMRHVVQGVGPRIQRYFDRIWEPGEARKGQLVVIGQMDWTEAQLKLHCWLKMHLLPHREEYLMDQRLLTLAKVQQTLLF